MVGIMYRGRTLIMPSFASLSLLRRSSGSSTLLISSCDVPLSDWKVTKATNVGCPPDEVGLITSTITVESEGSRAFS